MSKKIKLVTFISLTLLALVLLSLYFYINPTSVDLFPKCYFYSMTNLHCPGCGSQRALHDLLHGNIWQALQHNFLIILAFLVLVYQVYIWLTNHFKKEKKTKNILYATTTPWIIFGVIIVFWIARNIPVFPFTFLAP